MARDRNATEHAYSAIRDAIVQWEIQPGDPLFEEDLAQSLEVSRTPVREAIRLLSREGLVRLVPGRGAFVTDISVKTIVEVYQMRAALEALAARLAAASEETHEDFRALLQRFDDAPNLIREGQYQAYDALTQQMDELITITSDNEMLRRTLEGLWHQARRFRRFAYRRPERLLDTVEEHKAILSAILAHDPERAAQEAAKHIDRSLANALAHLGQIRNSAKGAWVKTGRAASVETPQARSAPKGKTRASSAQSRVQRGPGSRYLQTQPHRKR